jgi:uncharacterized protein (DUF1330 family)
MPAYLIGQITIKNQEKWNTYIKGVGRSILPFNAEVIFRGRRSKVLAGNHPHEHTVVIKFTDQATLQDWFNSPDYQELIPIRDEAAEVVIVSYDA